MTETIRSRTRDRKEDETEPPCFEILQRNCRGRVFLVLGRVTLAVRFVALEGFLFAKRMETGETNVCFMLIICSSTYERRHVPYAYVMFPLVAFIIFSFQQQEVHSADVRDACWRAAG